MRLRVLSAALWCLGVISGIFQADVTPAGSSVSLPWGLDLCLDAQTGGRTCTSKPPEATCGHRGAALCDLNLCVRDGPFIALGWPHRECAHRQPLDAETLA